MLLPNKVKPAPKSASQSSDQPSIKTPLRHINCVTHEGKVVLVGTDTDGQLWYTVKQDGFEDIYLQTPEADRIGWEDWQFLELPNEVDDLSVVKKETAELTDKIGDYLGKDQPLLRSRYKTQDQTAIAPVQLVSELGYIYVFRQSKSNTLLVDRFVLDGLTNRLNRKLDVRFKRSRQKHEPIQSQRKERGSLLNVDALDFVDIQDKPFYEPTTELSLIKNLHQRWFSVVLLPTQEQDQYRWHIFTARKGDHIVEITTLRASEQGLFDLQDYTVLEPEPRRIAGIIQRQVNLGSEIAVDHGITATRYDIQRERETEAKDDKGNIVTQLLRESVRVMLVVGTSQGPAIALSFAVAADGTLSKITSAPATSQVCRSVTRQVLLPPNMLDGIKAIGRVKQPRQGNITQLQAGEDNEVIVASSQPTALKPTEVMQVAVTGSRDYNGLHSGIKKIDAHNFEITLPNTSQAGNLSDDSPVKWEEVLSSDTGLLYNGMITACEMISADKLKVTAFNHGLQDGDAVQIENTRAYDGTYTVSKVDDQKFCLEGTSWQAGTAINVRQQTENRRGIVLDGVSDHITLPAMNHDFSQGLTVEAWVYFDQFKAKATIIDFGNGAQADNIIFGSGSTAGQLILTLCRDYDLKLIAFGGVLPTTGSRLIAIARDNQDQLSLKVFDDRGTVVFLKSGATLAGVASDEMKALKSLLKNYWNVSAAKLLPADQKKIVEAVRAVLPTTPVIATQDEQSISINDVLETKKWIHLAATIDKTGQATLYKNGVSIKTGSLGLPPSLQRSQNYLGKSDRSPAVYWPGKLSQVRLWNRACSADEIKNGMMLPAKEQTPGLKGDWRLDAIAEGAQRTVVDFSINGNDGTVIGRNAYINHSAVLQRNLEGTTIVAERYENEDLFAVSERATYLEEFEFRPQRVAPNGTISDVAVSGLTFNYKGKKNHSAKDLIPFDDEYIERLPLEPLTAGWYKASCKFTVPDGISLVRSFGISNIVSSGGADQQWTQIEIRRHKITLDSHSITAETYHDILPPNQLEIATAAASKQGDRWERLTALEQAEAILLKRQQELVRARQANQSADITGSDLSSAITASETKVQDLIGTVNRLQSEYDNLINNPSNFWCYIVAKHSSRGIEAIENQWESGAGIKQGQEVNDSNKGHWGLQWKFEPLGDGFYKIVGRYASALCLHISGADKDMNHARIDQNSWVDVNWMRWKLDKLSDGSYKILSKNNLSKGLDVSGQAMNNGAVIQLFPCTDNAPSRTWWIRTGEALDSRVDNKKRDLDAKKDELDQEQKKLQQLKDRQDVDTKLPTVIAQLGIVQGDLKTELQDMLRDRKNAASVQMRSLITDDRQLTTQVAVLDFVRPASRLSAIATCEGTVQLSYFDAQGRMRQTHFDATADRHNATFEEWIPDAQRTCLNFEVVSNVTLEKPINLDTEWTVEAWFFYPFRAVDSDFAPNKWTVLVSGGKRQPIVVRDGKHLGTRFDDRFYNSGYNLENLTVGWHHVTAVGKPNGMGSTTLFYINGEKVGEAVSTAALALNGIDDSLDCGDTIDLKGKSFTIEFWARRAPLRDGEVRYLLTQGSFDINISSGSRLSIAFPNEESLQFSCAGLTIQGPSYDAEIEIKDWYHWACVYEKSINRRQIYIYRDGQLIARGTPSVDYNGSGNLVIGKAWANTDFDLKGFNRQLSDLRIWNRALTPLEISTNWDKTPTTDKDLLGWWQFSLDKDNKAVATNLANPKATTTLTGNSKVESSPVAISISQIGNASPTNRPANSAHQPAGKLAEIRVWQVALNPTEIAANSNTLLTGNEPNLVAYYPLNEGIGSEVKNQTGDSNNGNIEGSIEGEIWQICALPIGSLGDLVIQRAMQFGDAAGFITLPLTGSVLGADFTVEAWIKVSAFSSSTLSILGTDTKQQHRGLHLAIRNQKAHYGFYDNDTAGTRTLSANTWYHIAFRYSKADQEQAIFIDGKLDKAERSHSPFQGTDPLKIGSSLSGNYFRGRIAELRIWNKALTEGEILVDKDQCLISKKPGLVAYYPLNDRRLLEHPQHVTDLVSNQRTSVNGTVVSVNVAKAAALRDALISCEYSTVSKDKSAMMRRFFAAPSPQGVLLLPDKRIEALELQWIGNGQFAPTLLGYIEGAPPIPSENLTLEDNYNGATSVELALSEDVEFKWTRTQESGLGYKGELFAGLDVELSAGVAVTSKILSTRSGYRGALETDYKFQNETNISSKSSLSMTDKLKLSGTQEQAAHFPHLGKRFIPKNVGYALVVSALADVFITRLKRTGRMIGYQVLPVDGIPPDVNTITFLINPAYTMTGSLDGMTGSSATSQRFFKHVPEMRSRFGSVYPASYYRLKEAYDLKHKIDEQDKYRAAYFAQFNSRLVDETSLGKEIDQKVDEGAAPGEISPHREEDKPDAELTDEQKQTAEQEKLTKQKQETDVAQAKQSQEVKNKQAEIDKQIKDPNLRANASASFARWQKRMETIQIRSGKRNIVNTYVWDADGGLRAEAQSFANTAEHSIGGTFSMNAALGWEEKLHVGVVAVELTAQATVSLTQTMTKTETRSKGIQLNVDLSGVESRGITNHDDLPLLAGEKVNRYRFMSFYLEGSTNHFYDFFSYVVDPEWLAGNSEEARALRQAKGKANKAWRVLHRVTYVERPALAGFSQDVRQLPPAISEGEQQIALLKEKVATMEGTLDKILQLLEEKNGQQS